MKARLRKWGNNAALQIPAAILESAHLGLDDLVDVREEKGCILIEPLQTKRYDLTDLIQRINSKNRHSSLDLGPPVGKELW